MKFPELRISRKALAASRALPAGQKPDHHMDELLNDHEKFSSPFVIALKVLGRYRTLRAGFQMTWVFTPPDLFAVLIDLIRGCRIIQEKLARIAGSSIGYKGILFFDYGLWEWETFHNQCQGNFSNCFSKQRGWQGIF